MFFLFYYSIFIYFLNFISNFLIRYYPLWPTGLTDLFLAATHGSKTRLTNQGEHAHIRLSPKSSLVDVEYYNPPLLKEPGDPVGTIE